MSHHTSRGILKSYLNKEVVIRHIGNLETQGLLNACDSNMNIYLTLASRKSTSSDGNVNQEPLGAVVVRGSNVASVMLKEGLETLYTNGL
mmetsp:Transcript_606/g.1014  ORF Transcript_606/g.1014 Transcript_606/m.1014 type:complete len:90 (+) Transcript_606:80-349(+)